MSGAVKKSASTLSHGVSPGAVVKIVLAFKDARAVLVAQVGRCPTTASDGLEFRGNALKGGQGATPARCFDFTSAVAL
jgi:hypothetical protein